MANKYQCELCVTFITFLAWLKLIIQCTMYKDFVFVIFQPNPSGRKTILVLKDQNFLDEKIEIGNTQYIS